MLGTFFLFLAVVVVAGGLVMRARLKRSVRGEIPVGSDDPILRQILEQSEPPPEDEAEPLDEEQIRQEEDRFWEREWDDPEPWRG